MIEGDDEGVDLLVEDDGSGFPFSGSYSLDELELLRLGPRSIKRRVRTLGGDLTIHSRPPEAPRYVYIFPHEAGCARLLPRDNRLFPVFRFHAAGDCRDHAERVVWEWDVRPAPVIGNGSDWARGMR